MGDTRIVHNLNKQDPFVTMVILGQLPNRNKSLRVWYRRLWKSLLEKERLLKLSNFSYNYNDFNHMPAIHFYLVRVFIVVFKLFFRKGLNLTKQNILDFPYLIKFANPSFRLFDKTEKMLFLYGKNHCWNIFFSFYMFSMFINCYLLCTYTNGMKYCDTI